MWKALANNIIIKILKTLINFLKGEENKKEQKKE